jgi:hypothetical protein
MASVLVEFGEFDFRSSSDWIDGQVRGPFMERIWLAERTAATLTRMFRYGQSVFDVWGGSPLADVIVTVQT